MSTVNLLWRARPPDARNPDGGYVPVSNDQPIPVAVTAMPGSTAADQGEYEKVPASTVDQPLGAAGGIGDFLAGLTVTPATMTPGAVTVTDGATAMVVFVGGASSVSNLIPFWIQIGAFSRNGAWKVTTGADVSVIGVGSFT